ncbi:unnamed protein product [Effrenium voratum]|nr:unnamed protein product [Effrenium voratum]
MSRFLASTSVTAGTLSHEKLCKSPFFAECEAAFLTRLIKDLAVELFTAGDVIVEQGDHADKMYYLMMGEVEILVGHDRVRVAKLQEGTVFGEMAMFSHLGNGFARRSATIRAANFCDTRVINKDRFHAILKQHPKEKLRFEGIAQERKAKLDKSKAILRPEAKLELRPTAQNTSAASQAGKPKALLGRRASLPVSWANRKEGPAEVEESPKETPAEKLRRSLLSSVSSSSLGDYEVSKVKQEPTYVPMPDAIEEDDASSSESSFGSEEEAVQVEAARQTAPSPVVCCPKGRRPRVASLLVALRQVASPTPGPRPMRRPRWCSMGRLGEAIASLTYPDRG